MGDSEDHYTGVLLEDINHKLDAILEGEVSLATIARKVDNMDVRLQRLETTVDDVVLPILREHSQLLNEHSRALNEHGQILKQHTQILNEHGQVLNEHSRILNEHSQLLNEHSRILDEHSQILNEHSQILKQHTGLLKQHSGSFGQINARLDGHQRWLRKLSPAT